VQMSTWSFQLLSLPLIKNRGFAQCFSNIFLPHSSKAVQRQFPCCSNRSRILWMCSNIASSSTIFRFFNFCQRTEGGVPARNPKTPGPRRHFEGIGMLRQLRLRRVQVQRVMSTDVHPATAPNAVSKPVYVRDSFLSLDKT